MAKEVYREINGKKVLTYEKDIAGADHWYDYDLKGNLIHDKCYNAIFGIGSDSWYDSKGNEIFSRGSDGYIKWAEYDANGNCVHKWDNEGYEYWCEFDSDGKPVHYKDNDGLEKWYV